LPLSLHIAVEVNMEHEAVTPLIAARTRIEESMNELREKLSILNKKREAIQTAIDVLRSSDAELRDLQLPAKSGRVVSFDENAVETQILDILKQGPKSRPEISANLDRAGMVYSQAGLRRILLTNPHISKSGERYQTRYSLNGA
jgi:hypothetical protein